MFYGSNCLGSWTWTFRRTKLEKSSKSFSQNQRVANQGGSHEQVFAAPASFWPVNNHRLLSACCKFHDIVVTAMHLVALLLYINGKIAIVFLLGGANWYCIAGCNKSPVYACYHKSYGPRQETRGAISVCRCSHTAGSYRYGQSSLSTQAVSNKVSHFFSRVGCKCHFPKGYPLDKESRSLDTCDARLFHAPAEYTKLVPWLTADFFVKVVVVILYFLIPLHEHMLVA